MECCGWVRVLGGVREDEGEKAGGHKQPQKMLDWKQRTRSLVLSESWAWPRRDVARVANSNQRSSRCSRACVGVCEGFRQAHWACIWVGQASNGCEEDEEEDGGWEGRGREEHGKERKGDSCIILRSLHWTARVKAM